jgi:hypothetical protein
MIDPLKIASASRWAPGIAYVLAVAIVGALIFFRNVPPSPTAARDLGRNQLLAPGDLETSNIRPLLGQYLRKEVKRGATVTEDMVSAKSLPARIANTMAAMVMMSLRSLKAQNIAVGRDVQICLKTDAFGDPSKVLALDCDELVCMVLVRLPKVPTQTVDPDLLLAARLVTDPQTCSKPAP